MKRHNVTTDPTLSGENIPKVLRNAIHSTQNHTFEMLSNSAKMEFVETKLSKIARILNKGVANRTFLTAIYYFYLFFIVVFTLLIISFHGFGGYQPYSGTAGLVGFLLHIIPGAFFFIISLFQFNTTLRQKYPQTHRLTGQIYFLFQVIAWIGVVILWVSSPLEGGFGSFLGTPFFLAYWALTGWLAYKNAVNGNIPAHHTWIIRNSVYAFAIVLVRPFTVTLIVLSDNKMATSEALSVSIYFCFMILTALGEWCIYARFNETCNNKIEVTASDPPVVELPVVSKVNHMVNSKFIPQKRLSGSKFTTMSLIARHSYSNSSLLRFKIEQPDTLSAHIMPAYFSIPPTHHISVRSIIPQKNAYVQLIRPYTPISTAFDHRNGYIDLLVGRRGPFSTHLVTMPVGSRVSVLPHGIGRFVYESNAQPNVLLIAAGTGITPIFSLLRTMVEDVTSTAEIKLVWYGKEECELKCEIEEYQAKSMNYRGAIIKRIEFRVAESNKVSEENLKDWVPDNNVAMSRLKNCESWDEDTGQKACIFVCGPVEMEKDTVNVLQQMKFDKSLIWAFGLDGR